MDTAQFETTRRRLAQSGVIMMDPGTVYVEDTVTVGEGTLLLPGVILRGNTIVGRNCEVGPNTMLVDCTVGDGSTVNNAQCFESSIGADCEVGPYTHLRPHSVVEDGSKIGAFVQLKNCTLGKNTRMAHLTYVGDADVGDNCNFGCGTVTCNYDGRQKFRTTIGNGCFLGCNTNLVAPVALGDGAYTAAGSTITDDVPAQNLAIARARQVNKAEWKDKRD